VTFEQWPPRTTGDLYSRHQVLGFDVAAQFVASMEVKEEDGQRRRHLIGSARPNEPTLAALESWRSLAITLSALHTYYWPRITHAVRAVSLSGGRSWRRWVWRRWRTGWGCRSTKLASR
jgi:hypothetical protein